MTEVDIFHENRYKEVKFGQDDAWISTCWEVLEKDVPAAVMATVRSQYAGYKIDDIEYVAVSYTHLEFTYFCLIFQRVIFLPRSIGI